MALGFAPGGSWGKIPANYNFDPAKFAAGAYGQSATATAGTLSNDVFPTNPFAGQTGVPAQVAATPTWPTGVPVAPVGPMTAGTLSNDVFTSGTFPQGMVSTPQAVNATPQADPGLPPLPTPFTPAANPVVAAARRARRYHGHAPFSLSFRNYFQR